MNGAVAKSTAGSGWPELDRAGNEVATLVLANHILAHHGVVDGFGHVSIRASTDKNFFLMSRSMAPALVTANDVQVYDSDGETDPALNVRSYLERFIHSEIYRLRPDVLSIVHSHSPNIVPFACVGDCELRPLFHMSAFLGLGVAHFEIDRFAGDSSDMLVRDARLGEALAGSLDGDGMVLMRGHGSTVVGSSLKQAVYRAIYAEVNAKMQIAAQSLGALRFLSPGESATSAANADKQLDRCWDLWVRDLEDQP